MSSRRTDPARRLARAAAIVAGLALASAGCGGRDAWLHDPLPDRGPVRPPAPLPEDAPRVRLMTSVGDIVVALYPEHAPIAVGNFLRYVDESFYDETIFHRVESPTSGPPVVQGGGYDRELHARTAHRPIPGEADNGLSNLRGTLAMARVADDPDSASSQFFINYLDAPGLDHQGPEAYGYTVFGVVVEGMEVVDRITLVPTRREPRTSFMVLPMVEITLHRASRD